VKTELPGGLPRHIDDSVQSKRTAVADSEHGGLAIGGPFGMPRNSESPVPSLSHSTRYRSFVFLLKIQPGVAERKAG
jgi:hypothetical protein